MKVPFLDLKALHREIKPEVIKCPNDVMENTACFRAFIKI